jgi:hypothetical protein
VFGPANIPASSLAFGTGSLNYAGLYVEPDDMNMVQLRKILPFLLIIVLLLNGCILERIFTVQKQLCDFDRNFEIDISEGFRIILREPVMLDEDITWLAGAQPSEQELIGDDLVMIYIAERKGGPADGRHDLPIELRFVPLNGKYRLKEGALSKNITEMLTEDLLIQIMQSVCRSKKSLIKQQIVIDISTLDRSLLPGKPELTRILGPPNHTPGFAHKLVYDYQLKHSTAPDKETLIEIELDDADEKVDRIRIKYLRYHLDADFEKGKAVLSVELFEGQEAQI